MSEPRPRAARISGLLAVTAATSMGLLPATPALAVTGAEPAVGTHPYAVQLSIGGEADGRGCTGTLVDKLWVLTAASCFATTPGSPVPAGKPALAATATLSDGKVVRVTEIAPRDDRDAALVRLAAPVKGIKTATLAGSAPATGGTLTAAGFGRTKTEWVTDKLRTGSFTLDSTTAGELSITGKGTDAICKGDTGGPLLNADGEIVGVNSRSWQGGCLGTAATETRTGAISARVDGLGPWLESTKQLPAVLRAGDTLQPGDTIASDNAKLIMQTDGNLVIYHTAGGQNEGGALWASGTGGNPGAFAKMQADGNVVVYKKGGGESDAASALWSSRTWNNPDARLELQADANLVVYTKDGGHGIGGHLWHSDTYPRGDKLPADGKLMPGSWLTNGKQVLIMDIQGNVLIRETATGRELWGKYTWDWYSYLHMQNDGNLVQYKRGTGNGSGGLWSTSTWNGAGSYATLDPNGSLTVRWKEGGPRWSSLSLLGEQSGRCLDFNGTNAVIWDCWGGANQQWDYTAAKELRTYNGTKCLTAEPGAPQTSRLTAEPCDGRAEQKWNYDGTTIASAVKPDQCVNVFSEATANNSAVGLWQCGAGANAKWRRA
ncbi:trypsin-like serine protease [Streptomyces sp. NPDC127114]|uniref:trypsin-like serine protease n=1 Tax=Streptomyces sp. NPDC127114 TaxID=3345366 RepID=UPI003627E7B1